jgi:hypothetical protein
MGTARERGTRYLIQLIKQRNPGLKQPELEANYSSLPSGKVSKTSTP